MTEAFESGDQEVPEGFSDWAGIPYSGPRIPVERQLGGFNFRALTDRPAWCYDDHAEWREVTTRLANYYSDRVRPLIRGDDELTSLEDEFSEKMMTNWRAIGFGRLAFASNFRSESTSQAVELKPWIQKRARAYLAAMDKIGAQRLREIFLKSKIKLNKGKGAPFWQAGSNTEAGLALAVLGRRVRDFSALREMLSDMSGGTPMYMTMYIRTQGSRKDVPLRFARSGRIFAMGEWRGPKVRTVKAPPFAENNVIAPVYDVHKAIALEIWPDVHMTDSREITKVVARLPYGVSTDLSNCDDRISLQTLNVYREELLIPIWQKMVKMGVMEQWRYDYCVAYDELIVDRRILSPPTDMRHRLVLLDMIGGVKSGERGTTMKDLDLVACRVDARITYLKKKWKYDYRFVSWGDDVYLYSSDPNVGEHWEAVPVQNSLWKEKIEPGQVFLMRRVRLGYGYMMRYASRRVNREANEEATSDLAAAVGVRATYDALTSPSLTPHPHPAAREYFPMLHYGVPKLRRAVDLAKQTPLRELAEAYIHTPEVRRGHAVDLLDRIDDESLPSMPALPPKIGKQIKVEIQAVMTEEEVLQVAQSSSISERDIRAAVRR